MIGRLRASLMNVDTQIPWFGVGRTVIALGQASVLLFTSPTALMAPVAGEPQAPYCDDLLSISLYCIGGDAVSLASRHWILFALLVVVASGLSPRFTGPLHLWISFSLAESIALPDGGDIAAKVITLLILPICIMDSRLWHWTSKPKAPLGEVGRGIVLASLLAVRLQLAGIYLHSGIGKFASEDWLSGVAEYYVLKDGMFGASGLVRDVGMAFTSVPALVVLVTWGSIALEIALGLMLVLGSDRTRVTALALATLFHLGIIVTVGLWSFGLIMIGAVTIAAIPTDRRSLGTNSLLRWASGTSRQLEESHTSVARSPANAPAPAQ
jgi:antimicrobial peptide system SdpB family protein